MTTAPIFSPHASCGKSSKAIRGRERERESVDKEMVAEQGMGNRWDVTAEGRENTQQ